MTDQIEAPILHASSGYALGQLAKALLTPEEHRHPQTRRQPEAHLEQWLHVLQGTIDGTLDHGSRAPVSGVPAWATLEVVTGGFATGELLAGGPLLEHERKLLRQIGCPEENRRALNGYFLTEDGVAYLRAALNSGRYEIQLPEEGALLVVAWLLEYDHAALARELLNEVGPFFDRLRFYPIPASQPRRLGGRVYLQDAGRTVEDLQQIQPNPRMLAQKEAIEVWTPLYDETIRLFLETVEGEPPTAIYDAGNSPPTIHGGWPCRLFPNGWNERVKRVLNEYEVLRDKHQLCGKPERKGENFPQLRQYLRKCIEQKDSLTERDFARIRTLLARALYRRGVPDSPRWQEVRAKQVPQVSAPMHHTLSQVVIARLSNCAPRQGGEDLDAMTCPVSSEEATRFEAAVASEIPTSIRRKVQRCGIDTVDALIENGVIPSSETLAQVLPQLTSELQAAGIIDPSLRQLYATIYQAFRRRRSLLLLNLESQVKLEELPWVAAIDRFRRDDLSTQELARETLKEVVALAILSFPQAIIPNKLLQEFRALVKRAKLNLPLVDELAADIFMGQFTPNFVRAAKTAARLLDGTLYATYYQIDSDAVENLPESRTKTRGSWFRKQSDDPLLQLCSSRAGVTFGNWNVAINGMILEQQQILTTQNLAVLFVGLDLIDELQPHLLNVARRCFTWVVHRLQVRPRNWHAGLITLKNTAYAWRQTIFYLALLPRHDIQQFAEWAEEHLASQSLEFRARFRPALRGLRLAMAGMSPEDAPDARRFLGWTKQRHWLMEGNV